MRVLVALVLSVLGCSLAERLTLSKCDLKKAFDIQTDSDDLQRLDLNSMAKIVCFVERKLGFNTSAVTRAAKDETLYGLFQLSNLLACSDTTPPPNICSMDCNNFIDDDLSDDIKCLLKLHAALLKNGIAGPHSKKLQQWYKRIFLECGNKTSDYLDECAQ